MANDGADHTGKPDPNAVSTATKPSVNVDLATQQPTSSAASSSRPSQLQDQQEQPTRMAEPQASAMPQRVTNTINLAPHSTSSATASPHTSRHASPIRKDSRPTTLTSAAPSQPSAAAIQRALSAAQIPQLPSPNPGSEATSKLPRANKTSPATSGEMTPQWPLSPRVKSPPPSSTSSRRNSNTTPSSKPPTVVVESSTPPSSSQVPPKPSAEDTARRREQQVQTPQKVPSRGPSGKSTLATVQENSADSQDPSPAALQAAADLKPVPCATNPDASLTMTPITTATNSSASSASAKKSSKKKDDTASEAEMPAESGSESAGNKSDNQRGRRTSSNQIGAMTQINKTSGKSSYGTLASAKSRQSEGKQAMTVETETVPSIPQSALSAGERLWSENGGSVRTKPSSETIRPKRDRKRTPKPRNITQGTASSKADIFEARVTDAVNAEAHSSDSDDTFVYESNPPESQRPRRHHSRTPSVTSAHSVNEQRSTIRPFGDVMDDRKVAGKRSMKFSSHNDFDGTDLNSGTIRSHRARRARHESDGTHASLLDDTFSTHASRLRSAETSTRSRPHSPRSPVAVSHEAPTHLPGTFGRKLEQSFDMDGEGADDERTPLISDLNRTPRSSRGRRPPHGNIRSIDEFYASGESSTKWSGFLRGCCLGIFVVVGAIVLATLILVLWSRPLYDVDVRRIHNVLATQEQMLLDLYVSAVNPNVLSVSISDADLRIFAKSKHVGKSLDYTGSRLPPRGRPRRSSIPETSSSADDVALVTSPSWPEWTDPWHMPHGGVDDGTDPPGRGDLEKDAQTMVLGRVFHFDQALTFDNSVWSRRPSFANGELTVMKPGNKTEAGGSARWERVLQFPFELIVRGTLRYHLPFSSRTQSVAIEASVIVHPEDGVDQFGCMRLEKVHDTDY